MNGLEEKYPYLVAWCRMMGSYDYYLERQIEKAEQLGTPTNIIYFSGDEFSTFDDIVSESTKERIIGLIK